MKIYFLVLLLSILPVLSHSQIKHALRDDAGRHVIPRGFVMNTNDGKGEVFFNRDDYVRMVRMGANYQVIRLELGKISHFPGASVREAYLLKLDTLVEMGKHLGIKTVFKLTRYGINNFSWEAFWLNKDDKLNGLYLNAWKIIWKRYADNPWVVGYDLINEPRKLEMDISYDRLTKKYLIPLYQRLIDSCHEINDEKMCLIQTIFMNKGEAINHNQYAEIKHGVKRKNIIFSPHIYQEKKQWIKPTMLRFDKESDMLDAPILIGEWGFPTFDTTDSTITGRLGQLNYMDFYIRTAELFDSLGVGSIKAWFLGNSTKQHFMSGGPSTWSIFSDMKSVGTIERKYITDIIARPYPQCIAGDIKSFKYDFATRSLKVNLKTDNSRGPSRIFVGADRHYPDGFTIKCGDGFVLCYNPLRNVGLEVHKFNEKSNPNDFIWNESKQQLIILQWPEDDVEMKMKIVPGIDDL